VWATNNPDAEGLALESLCSASDAADSRSHAAIAAEQIIGMGNDQRIWRRGWRQPSQLRSKILLAAFRLECGCDDIGCSGGAAYASIAVYQQWCFAIPPGSELKYLAYVVGRWSYKAITWLCDVVHCEIEMLNGWKSCKADWV